MTDVMQARASDQGFCWSILCEPEQATEVSAGWYGAMCKPEQVNEIPTGGYFAMCKPKQVTDTFSGVFRICIMMERRDIQ